MPRLITVGIERLEVATEEELLEFVNKARAAGGADVLDALLPSTKSDRHSCLIANGLNFGCSVYPIFNKDKHNGMAWVMDFAFNMTREHAKAIAKALDCPFVNPGAFAIILPDHIGNAAHAFDMGAAFQEYAV